MSERFERVYEGDKNLFIDGAPVLIRANALLKDTLTGNMIAQIKYQNVSSKKITYLKAVIEGQNVLKETVPEEIFEYQNQSAGEYEIFGAKTPLVLKNDSIRSFSVRVIGVAFDDGTIWTCEKGEWKADLQFGLNVDREVAYRSAQKSMNEANTEAAFKAAAEEFHGITGFKDADALAEQCLVKAESARREAIYDTALKLRAEDTIQALEQAISQFKQIPDYKDAEKAITLCEERIMAIRDENEKLRVEKENRAEVARIEREKKQKKVKKAFKIAIPSLVAVIAIILLIIFLIVPSLTLSKAVSLMEEGNYIEAENILNQLDGFGSSENKIAVLKAMDTLEKGDYDSAIKQVLSASEKVVVSYNLCGGTSEQGDRFIYTNSSDYSALITPQKEGYRFIEWTLSSYHYSKKDSLQLFFDAVWSDEFSITYELNGGSAKNPASYHKDGDAVILNDPVREGYSFIGWTGTDLEEPTQTVLISKGSYGDRTFMANWHPNVYTFTLEAAGGSVSKTSLSAAYDSVYELPIPTRDYYTFAGWFDGRTRYENGTWKKDSDITLTAKWTPIDYTITYNLNGGKNSSRNSEKYTVESKSFLFSEPTKTGYAFVGWYKDSSFVNQITGIEAGSHENVSVYAKWEIVNYTIAYEMSGGSVSTSMPTSFTINDLPISLPSASRDGYVFLNWNENAFDGKIISKITNVGNVTLFAGFLDPNLRLSLSYDKKNYSVEDYLGSASEVIIPAYYNGKPVTSILSNAFYDCDSLVTVKIPSTVDYIGSSAFEGCRRIANVNIPNAVTYIARDTFSNCESLASIKLPSSLKSIGDSAFSGSGLKSIDLPFSVTDIGNHAFSWCSHLTSVYIPSGVKVLSCGIFSNCTALTSVTIPHGLTEIEYVAFENCTSLESIVIPESVTKITSSPFEGCKKLTIYCRASVIPGGWSSGWNSSCPVVWGYRS